MATVLKITESTFKLAADEASLATGTAFSCQITAAELNSVPKSSTVPATMCDAETETAAASGWELRVGWLQDWGATDSLSEYLFENDATDVAFEILPTDSAMPKLTGTCSARAGAYGGDMGTVLLAESTMPCLAKPTVATAAAAAAAAAPAPDQPVAAA